MSAILNAFPADRQSHSDATSPPVSGAGPGQSGRSHLVGCVHLRTCGSNPLRAAGQDRPERSCGETTFWDMGPLSTRWQGSAMGLISFRVLQAQRGQGLGEFLLAESLRQLQDSGICARPGPDPRRHEAPERCWQSWVLSRSTKASSSASRGRREGRLNRRGAEAQRKKQRRQA